MTYTREAALREISKADPFADARLVEDLRLCYSHIVEGRYSEQFYICLFRVIERKVYLGYFTFAGQHVKLKGILDFLHSKHYGLGIKNLADFMLAFTDQMIYDETESQYARQTVKWLRNESVAFKFPRKCYEYERLLSWIRYRKAKKKITQKEINLFIRLFNQYPDTLKYIGEGRTYRTFEQAAIAVGIVKAIKKRNVPFNEDMTEAELRYAARQIYSVVGETVNHRFIEILLECQELKGKLPNAPEPEPEPEEDELEVCKNYDAFPEDQKWGSEITSLTQIYDSCSESA